MKDRTGHALAYVYYEEEPGRRAAAHLMIRDEARVRPPTEAALSVAQTLWPGDARRPRSRAAQRFVCHRDISTWPVWWRPIARAAAGDKSM